MDGEQLFQHARRLVIAEMQNILYGEYLPLILGNVPTNINNLRNNLLILLPQSTDFFEVYNYSHLNWLKNDKSSKFEVSKKHKF